MKKSVLLKLLVLGTLVLAGCTDRGSSSEPSSYPSESSEPNSETSSDSSSVTSSQNKEESFYLSLELLKESVVFEQIFKMELGDFLEYTGKSRTYYTSEELKAIGQTSLTFNADGSYKKSDDTLFYLADQKGERADEVYEEVLSAKNRVEKSYQTYMNGEPLYFSQTYVNPFATISPLDVILSDNDQLEFINIKAKKQFLAHFYSAVSGDENVEFIISEEGEMLGVDVSIAAYLHLTIKIVAVGDLVVPARLSPLVEDMSEKSELSVAITNLGKNYTVIHDWPGEQSILYYTGDQIVYDNGADGVTRGDIYFYQEEDSNVMNRLVYDQGHGGIYSWDKNHFSELLYQDDWTYNDLALRLEQLNLGLFSNDGNGVYTSIEGAASIVARYAQPTPNANLSNLDDAVSVEINVENEQIKNIKIKYRNFPYETGQGEAVDTISFSDVGTTIIPQNYIDSILLTEANKQAYGIWEGVSKLDESLKISLEIFEDLSAIYTVGEDIYEIEKIGYEESHEWSHLEYLITFDYDEGKRYAALSFSTVLQVISGKDSSYEDETNYFNLSLNRKM